MPTGPLPGHSAGASTRDVIRSQVDALFKTVTTDRPRDPESPIAEVDFRIVIATTDEEAAEPLPP